MTTREAVKEGEISLRKSREKSGKDRVGSRVGGGWYGGDVDPSPSWSGPALRDSATTLGGPTKVRPSERPLRTRSEESQKCRVC